MKLQPRDFQILTWLVHMKFMLLDQIAEVFFEGSNPNRAPYRRILKLMNDGLIDTRKVHEELCDVYVPTKKAVRLLKSNKIPYALGLSKDQAGFNYGHDKTLVDLRIFFRQLGIGVWIPERIIRAVKPRGWHPDGLLLTKNALNAIEYEHTEKKLERYNEILRRYEKAMKCYQRVLYITVSPSLRKRLSYKYGLAPHIFFITKEELFLKRQDAVFKGSEAHQLAVRELTAESIDLDLGEFDPKIFKNRLSEHLEYLPSGILYSRWDKGDVLKWEALVDTSSPLEDEDCKRVGAPAEEVPCSNGRTSDC